MKPKETLAGLEDDGHCFVCGDKNTDGLRLRWTVEGDETFADFVPEKKHQGWKDILHGGLLATLLDEAMTRLVWKKFGAAVTAEMTVRYLTPAKIGDKLRVWGKILENNGRLVKTEAKVFKRDGSVAAHASGKALKL